MAFTAPFGCIALENGTTVMVEQTLNRLRVVDGDGNEGFLGGKGSAPGQFDNPHGIDRTGDLDQVVIADTGNAQIQILRLSTGKTVKILGGGKLKKPWDVASVPSDAILLAADVGLRAIAVFDCVRGNQLCFLDDSLFSPKPLNFPSRLEFDHVYKIVFLANQTQEGETEILSTKSRAIIAVAAAYQCDGLG